MSLCKNGAGGYRNYITIQSVTYTPQSDGSTAETWATQISLWAKIMPLTGREYYSAQQTQAEMTHNFYARYTPSVTPSNRISWNSRIFDILDVVNVEERGVEMILRCKERLE